MPVYNSIHEGEVIDNFDSRIATNTNSIATNTNNIATNANNIATNTNNIATNTNNIATKVSKTGDTITGNLTLSGNLIQIRKAGAGSSWIEGRDKAIIRTTSCPSGQYCPCVSIKTLNGSWEIGSYSYDSQVNKLSFSYGTDTNYNNKNNSATQCWITTAGAFANASKRELKENIKNFNQSALDIIKNTQIYSFNMKADPAKDYRVGFIADDTNPILSGKNQDIMDLQNCIGILLKAVQELNEKNCKIRKRE